jgi:acetyltransferase
MVLYDPGITEQELPNLAIRPYPARYISSWTTRDAREITIRPILPEEEPLMIKFHESLSESSVNLRYLQLLLLSQRVAN